MKKIIIGAVFITGILAAFFFVFLPHDMTRDDIINELEKNKSAYQTVAEYFVNHRDVTAPYIYTQDASEFAEIQENIKKTLDSGFLYIGIKNEHKEIVFGTSSQGSGDDHMLIYSPYSKPTCVSGAEQTKVGGWYIKM